jgi:hypothetical protein
VDDEIDPNLFEPVAAAFETMNKISPAQRDFCERTVEEMETDPYDKWTSLWKRAPDATLLDNTKFDQTVADRYDLLDVFFWSPSRLKQWRKLGVVMPCALHGWMHADKVTVKQRWACRLVKDITALFPKLKDEEKKNDRAMLAAAHTRFFQLEPTWNAYLALKLKNFATFKKDLAEKQKKLTEMEKSYTDVLTTGNPDYGIAALTRIGLLYSDLAVNLTELPDPKGFDEDQVALFRGQLEEQYIFPLEEKAVEALEKALGKSSELTLYTEWTLLAQDKLNKYKPGSYGKTRDMSYRGSEFFVTSGFEKQPPANDAPLPTEADAPKPAVAPTPAPTQPSAAATGAGAGSR